MDVSYAAQLARLKLSPEETERFQSQLDQVLAYVEQLKKLDVTGIEPMAHAIERNNVFRSDQSHPSLSEEAAVANAPRNANNLFIVPKVVE